MDEMAVRRAAVTLNQVWLKTLPPAGRFAFYGDGAARAAAASAWSVEFSEVPLRASIYSTRATLWMGPDEYLLLDFDNVESLDALDGELSGVPHALVDIGHRQFALEVSGPHAATILSGACPLDLDLSEFPVGMCTRTVFAKADIVLWRTRDDAFHVEVWRSFAGYVTGILAEIATEFYPAR